MCVVAHAEAVTHTQLQQNPTSVLSPAVTVARNLGTKGKPHRPFYTLQLGRVFQPFTEFPLAISKAPRQGLREVQGTKQAQLQSLSLSLSFYVQSFL